MSQANKLNWWNQLIAFLKAHVVIQVISYLVIGFALLMLLGYFDWITLPKYELTGPKLVIFS